MKRKKDGTESKQGDGGGRPSKFGDLDYRQVERLAVKGWTDAEMCEFFGVDISTWTRWKQKDEKFRTVLKDWKAEADARVERSLYERACGYSHPEDKIFQYEGSVIVEPTVKHYPPDTTACIFWLKNRKREEWRDKVETEHSGDVTLKITRRVMDTRDVK